MKKKGAKQSKTKERSRSKEKDKNKFSNNKKKEKNNHKRKVVWDWESLAQQEKDRKENPVLMKIDEPQTPYLLYEDHDSTYLRKLNQALKIKSTVKEVLDDVSSKLKERKDSNDYIQVEIIEANGEKKKEYFLKDHQSQADFLEKRHKTYQNEFAKAKKYIMSHKNDEKDIEEESEEEALDNLTIKNTLINKVIGNKKP